MMGEKEMRRIVTLNALRNALGHDGHVLHVWQDVDEGVLAHAGRGRNEWNVQVSRVSFDEEGLGGGGLRRWVGAGNG